MKILFITRGYPSGKHMQLGNFEATQARALARCGHQVTIVSLNFLSVKFWDILGERHRFIDGIYVYERYCLAIPSNTLMPRNIMNFFLKKMLDKVYNMLVGKIGVPDIVHAHYLQISSFAILLKEKYNLPLVCTEHWSKINADKISNSVLNLGKKTYPYVDEIIAVSSETSRSIERYFNRKSTVIFNMVDNAFFEKEEINRFENVFTLIAIGEMNDYRKGFDVLLKAFSLLRKQTNARLLLVGRGKRMNHLKTLSENLNVGKDVCFLGEKSPLEIRRLISSSDALVLSSHIETFGVVLIEAMAQGKPVVATCCGGPEEFVKDDCGYLVKKNDIEDLYQGLFKIKQNINDFKSDVIREYCYNKFSEKTISLQILGIYEKVVARCKRIT
ncbi:glycosyltransferase family 4 protein [Parabacteroides distasonis]|uniref:Glycosyltransferase family 4 protein n=1 Tax=Parabacteroides distasonis TaxID=823 RepID=A0A7L5EEJ4_PARDI|nr:glycosyltransferase family 4 protein [Parabacteroides distasonis]QJE29015.1 glycosyltransferase family 4 protein [Parabacteroides distasonis]WRY44659.1 glycosyltransferase family 4 protein [Parabacteroides distasonis]